MPDTSWKPIKEWKLHMDSALTPDPHGQFVMLYIPFITVTVGTSQEGKTVQNTDYVNLCFMSQIQTC